MSDEIFHNLRNENICNQESGVEKLELFFYDSTHHCHVVAKYDAILFNGTSICENSDNMLVGRTNGTVRCADEQGECNRGHEWSFRKSYWIHHWLKCTMV